MKKKTLLITVLSVALIATLAIGTTMALLKTQTDEVTNTFTSDKKITISLREPKWDGYGFDKETALPEAETFGGDMLIGDSTYPKGASAVSTDTKYGCNIASQYMPGDLIPKNPIVKNTSEDEAVYVAVTVECFDGKDAATKSIPYGTKDTEGSFANKFGTITFNSNWTQVGTDGNKLIYVYGSKDVPVKLMKDEVTASSVFKEVKLNDEVGEGETVLPSFEVKVNAYAIQEKNVAPDAAAVTKLTEFVTNHQAGNEN